MTTDGQQFTTLQSLIVAHLDELFAQDDEVLSKQPAMPAEQYDSWRYHMNNALNLLEMQGRSAQKVPSIEETLGSSSAPILLVDQIGKVLEINAPAARHFELNIGDVLDRSLVADEDRTALTRSLAALPYTHHRGLLQLVRISAHQHTRDKKGPKQWVHMALSASALRDGRVVGMLAAAEVSWTEQAGRAFKSAFALTNAEFEILSACIQGKQLTEVASARSRSVNTLRVQRSKLFKKLAIHSQVQLTRLYCGFKSLEPPAPKSDTSFTTKLFTRPSGRQLEVRFFGSESGRPVLFFHDYLLSLDLPVEVIDTLPRHNIRLICVCRNGFAGTSRCPENADPTVCTIDDCIAVLDWLELDQLPVLAHQSGAISAIAFTRHAATRVSSLTIVSGSLPMLDKKSLSQLPAIIRAAFLVVKYLPEIAPFISRAGIAFSDMADPMQFLHDRARGSPGDLAMLENTELCEVLLSSRDDALRQGYPAVVQEFALLASDWRDYLKLQDLPMAFLYGREDFLQVPNLVEDFVSQFSNAELKFFDHIGRLLFFREADAIFESLIRLEQHESS